MIPGRQMGRSRAVARAVAKNAGIPPEVFDKFWDEYEKDERVRKGKYGAFRCPFLLGKYQSSAIEIVGNIH